MRSQLPLEYLLGRGRIPENMSPVFLPLNCTHLRHKQSTIVQYFMWLNNGLCLVWGTEIMSLLLVVGSL